MIRPTDSAGEIELAAESLAQNSKSFWLATLFLPKAVASDAAVLYRFCRMVDDIADEAQCPADAKRELTRIQNSCETGESDSVVVRGFLRIAERRNIPVQTAISLVDGVLSDLDTVRLRTENELLRYAYRVAGVVGHMMCGVLRVHDKHAIAYAVDLGLAMQLTNICRDVKEDAALGRVYVPADLLRKYAVTSEQFLALDVSPDVMRCIINELLDLADKLYARALHGMHYIPFRSRIGILIARRVYRAIGHKLRTSHGSDPRHGRTVVGPLTKVMQIASSVFDLLRPATLGWWRAGSDASGSSVSWEDLDRPHRFDERPRMPLTLEGGQS